MKTDVLIIGAGPGGTATSMFLAEQGIRSVLVEKEQFPRYQIGESMTGECSGVIRALGLEQKMMSASHPIKRGVTVYGTGGKNAWFVPVMARDSEWKLTDQFTWQVRRSDFDRLMLNESQERGAELILGQATNPILDDDGRVLGVEIRTSEGEFKQIRSEVVVDASGQKTYLANAGVTGPKYSGSYDKQIAIYSQVAGAIRDDEPNRNDTLIFYQQKYHWAWFIPLDDDVVSVGVVAPAAYFKEKGESKHDFLVRELHELNPEMARRVPEIELTEEVRASVNYSYQVRGFGGNGFLCVGDAHRFIDPIFSFGLYVTMKEAQFASEAIRGYLAGETSGSSNPFYEHTLKCEMGIDILEDMIDSFWEYPLAFAMLVHVRYRELMIDLFAGRAYDRQPSTAVDEMRNLLERERTYDDEGLFSMPVGSRYHPERAQIWEMTTDV